MKKIRNILLITVLLFGLISYFNKVEAAGSVNLTSNASKVYIGDQFTVSVNVSRNVCCNINNKNKCRY